MNTAISAAMGQRIKDLRQARRWSQTDLAAKIGVSKTTMGQYEVGDRSPSYSVLIRLADTFGVSLDYLVRGTMQSAAVDSLPIAQADAIRTIISALTDAYGENN